MLDVADSIYTWDSHSRLWDIDVIIKRTLVYGTLTITLALLYVGLILAVQALLRDMISRASNSDIAIVISTLIIAALAYPLRRRIQIGIDHRFYRRNYDAAQTLVAFSGILRTEVNLNRLYEQLLAVVEETMQPTHVSLWLRSPERPRERRTRRLPCVNQAD